MRFRTFLEGDAFSKSIRRKFARAIYQYIGIKPQIQDFEVLGGEEFDKKYPPAGSEELFGRVGGIATEKGIDLRQGDETAALHELIHKSGFMPIGIGSGPNEGITQALAEDIASAMGFKIPSSYQDEVRFFRQDILPATGLDARSFYRGYANARHKASYVSALIWKRHGKFFSDPEDWGKEPRTEFIRSLQYDGTTWTWFTNAIRDEVL